MSRLASLLYALLPMGLLANPASAHDGPPYPILVDEAIGDHELSVWADPDVGTGTFYLYIDEEGAEEDVQLPIHVIVQPEDGRLPEVSWDARRADAKQPYQMIADVDFDRRGRWNVRFVVDGLREIALPVDVTPPGLGPIDLVWFLFPFLAIGFLWIKVIMKKRSLSSSAVAGTTVLLAFLCAEPASAQGDAGRPKYSFLQQNEDWSAFTGGDDFFDPIKHVKLNDEGSLWVRFGGRAESRLEGWNNFNFGAPPGMSTNDWFILSRLLVHGDLHAGDHFRLFVEGKTAQSTDRNLPGGRRPLDMDTLALQQAFVDVDLPLEEGAGLRLRPGRQALLYGAQRLISPLPWGNTLRTWDGVTVQWKDGGWSVDALFTAFVPVDKTDFNERDDDQLVYGLYAQNKREGGKVTELYALGTQRGTVNINGTVGESDRWTLGVRHQAAPSDRTDLEFEGAYQFGDVGPGDVSAGFATLELGWTPEDMPWNPRAFAILDYATGDDGAGGDVGTFDQLYPLGHAYLGYADVVARQNIKAICLGATAKPREDLTLRLAGHGFWLADKADAIYNVGGGVLRAPGSFSSSQIAYEVDLTAAKPFGRHLQASTGYSHVFAGDAIQDSGPSDDLDFAFLRLIFTF